MLVTLVLLRHKVCPVFDSLAGLYLQREDQQTLLGLLFLHLSLGMGSTWDRRVSHIS